MTDTPTRGGKYCPRCSAMARREAVRCEHCGHQFSTGLTLTPTDALHEPMPEDQLNRTRAFTLPPLPTRALTPDESGPRAGLSDAEVADLERSRVAGRRRRAWAYALFILVILIGSVLWWWLARRL